MWLPSPSPWNAELFSEGVWRGQGTRGAADVTTPSPTTHTLATAASLAWYDDRTSGPLSTCRNPNASP